MDLPAVARLCIVLTVLITFSLITLATFSFFRDPYLTE